MPAKVNPFITIILSGTWTPRSAYLKAAFGFGFFKIFDVPAEELGLIDVFRRMVTFLYFARPLVHRVVALLRIFAKAVKAVMRSVREQKDADWNQA